MYKIKNCPSFYHQYSHAVIYKKEGDVEYWYYGGYDISNLNWAYKNASELKEGIVIDTVDIEPISPCYNFYGS